jgi:transglutaminase-like putative cysteine protease
MKYQITHTTEYNYQRSVSACHNEIHLIPRNFQRQDCVTRQLQINPVAQDYRERTDFFGNTVAYFSIQQPHERLIVTAVSEVVVEPEKAQLDFYQNISWESVCERLHANDQPENLNARQYLLDSPLVVSTPELANYAKPSFAKGNMLIQSVHNLMERIHNDFTYDPHFTTVSTPLDEVLQHRRGVCQDFAHLAIGCLRAQGIPARYVSGYVETLPPPGESRLIGADASHAWFSVYVNEVGWLDFDPTNNQMPMDRHITLAWGRDYSDVTPMKGIVFGGGKHVVNVSVDVHNLGA